MRSLEAVQQTLIDVKAPLPLPSSVLLDAAGEVAFIYKGPVSVEQLSRDLEMLATPPAGRLAAALPFEGKWQVAPGPVDPIQVALKFFESGDQGLARGYLRQLIALGEATPPRRKLDLAELHYFLGSLLEEDGKPGEAIEAYTRVIGHKPGYRNAHRNLGRLWRAAGDNARAARHLAEAVRLGERSAAVHHQLAGIYYGMGRIGEAAAQLREVLKLAPRDLSAANNLAWILATNADDSVRDGAEAVRWAMLPVEASRGQDPRALDTLAAAWAERGEFDKAVKTIEAALELAKGKDPKLTAKLQARLGRYRGSQPWRE